MNIIATIHIDTPMGRMERVIEQIGNRYRIYNQNTNVYEGEFSTSRKAAIEAFRRMWNAIEKD